MSNEILAKIGRPGIGGEFLAVERSGDMTRRYILKRYKQINLHRYQGRAFGVADLPASTMIYDLLSAIEAIVKDCPDVDLDNKGMSGDRKTLRDRFIDLSWHMKKV